MNKKFNVLAYAIGLGILLYIIDGVIFYFEFSKDYSLTEALLTNVPFWEILGRMLMVTLVIILGIVIKARYPQTEGEDEVILPKSSKTPHGQLNFNFLSSLSYQIRTPLNAIIGFSELLKKENLSPESKDIYINHINSSSKYLLLLINNLSEISKIESNELSISKKEVDVNKIIAELYDVFQGRKTELGKNDISLVIEKVKLKESFTILTDQERFKQVLHNLIDNALINTENGIIKLGYTVKSPGILEFYVNDSGRGFSQERLETIFARYNKLTDNQNMPFDGSVLRLAISKSLVKLLGGEIRADSKIGQGTVIYFTLPFEQVNIKPVEELKISKPAAPGTKDWTGRLLLISEDVESNYIYLEELLRPTRISLLWAKNGKEAVDHVKNNPKIELVLMDILMPEMDGYQASREIKALRKDLPIIAQTACMIEGNEENAKNFDSYLTKPIWAPQLYSSIEKYLH